MTNVGVRSTILKVSAELRASLQVTGAKRHFPAQQTLFGEEDGNAGVFLLVKGTIRMGVKNLPKLDRLFSAGSLLGLPSTFTGHSYSLTAQTLTAVDAVHVDQASFLELMRERPDHCREATDMLGREVTFIQSALAERRRQAASRKILGELAISS